MSPALHALNLSRVYRQCVFRSNSAVDSHEQLRHALADHVLRWSAGPVDSALFSGGSQRLKMFVLRYGPEVEVRPRPFDGFALVQMPLRGMVQIDSDGQRLSLGAGQAAIVAPRQALRLVWSRDCEQLILRLPHALVREAATRSTLALRGSDDCPWSPVTLLEATASAQWRGLVQSLLELAEPASPEAACHPAWLAHVEHSLALFLLTQPAAARGAVDDAAPAGGLPAPLAAVEQYIRGRLCAPLALQDLARAAGLSARTLHMHCQRQFGFGPMTWLRELRLDAAHRRLRSDAGASVTEVALACGFGHLGRFSAYYRARFGELPHQTAAPRH